MKEIKKVKSCSMTQCEVTRENILSPSKFSKYSEEEQINYINSLKYLLKSSTIAQQKKWSSYTIIEKYNSLYRKFLYEQRKNMHKTGQSEQITLSGKMRVVDYIASSKIETLDLSLDDLKKLSISLPKLLEEVNICLELREEDAQCLAEKKAQLQDIETKREELQLEISRLSEVA